MILSDRSIREELAAGRIVIDPLDEASIQPSSVDLHCDSLFRVFRNDTTPYIDPKQSQEDLTELVEVKEDGAFILHPGEFVLGSTLERVALPDDLVARLEGKSSLGRLGLLIHSSLPASETVMVLIDGNVEPRPISEVVDKQLCGRVVAFDPDTFEVGYHEITGWYEGPPDRIFEVELASGRRVRVTAGHNLFTVDRDGQLTKVRTGALRPGARVAVPRRIPDPTSSAKEIDVLALVPESGYSKLVCEGPTIAAAFDDRGEDVFGSLRSAGYRHTGYYRSHDRLPLHIARELGLVSTLGQNDSLRYRGGRSVLPVRLHLDEEFAWFLGMYVAEGYRRANQFVVSNTDQARLDRLEAALRRLELPVYRAPGAVTCCSKLASEFLGWLGTGGYAPTKRAPAAVFGWPTRLIAAFLDGVIDGDGSREEARTSVWTTSDGLVGDILVLCSRLGAAPVHRGDLVAISRPVRSTCPPVSTNSRPLCRCRTGSWSGASTSEAR